ncbi:MAG: hypothetical protein ONB23_10335 [candidate division KSB1 bacterium]|nr:hypothetical protein [candidate division KSB1 bacterium]
MTRKAVSVGVLIGVALAFVTLQAIGQTQPSASPPKGAASARPGGAALVAPPDHDGDGVPNGLDPDFVGPKLRGGRTTGGFVDLNGDGISDRAQDWDGDGIVNCQDPDWKGPVGSGPNRNQAAVRANRRAAHRGAAAGSTMSRGTAGRRGLAR